MDTPPPSRKRHLALGALVGLGALAAVASPCTPSPVDPERLKAHVRALSETFHPRDHRHPENLERAADYLSGALSRAGGRVHSEPYTAGGGSYRNVIATFGPEGGERLVIGAHYDAAEGAPGADDNASGVAGLLELAAWLGAHPPPMRVDLVGFTLEEPPHFRSTWTHGGARGGAPDARRPRAGLLGGDGASAAGLRGHMGAAAHRGPRFPL